MNTKKQIAQSLIVARKNARLKLKEVAFIVGKSEKTISAWEHELSQPDAEALLKLAEIYGFSTINDLLGFSCNTPLIDTLLKDERELLDIYRSLDSGCKQIVMTNALQVLEHLSKNKLNEFAVDHNFSSTNSVFFI